MLMSEGFTIARLLAHKFARRSASQKACEVDSVDLLSVASSPPQSCF